MTISRTYWTQLLSVILIVILLLESIETRPHKKAKRKHNPKHCGSKGHLCQPGSRKLCCGAGFTCKVTKIASNWTKSQSKRKQKIGICQPVFLVRVSEREIEGNYSIAEIHPIPKVHRLHSSFRL